MIKILNAITLLCAFSLSAEHEYKPGILGEYYEYDIEGSPKDIARRKAKHRVSNMVKKPVKISIRAVRKTKRGLRKTSHAVENYLRGHISETERAKLNHALTDWETAMEANPAFDEHRGPRGLSYVPHQAWRLFKYSLYLVGFALPRTLKKGVKNSFYHTFTGLSNHIVANRH